MKRFLLILSVLLISISSRAAIGTYIPQTYSRTFVVEGVKARTIYDRLRLCPSLDNNRFKKEMFQGCWPAPFNKQGQERLRSLILEFNPTIQLDGVKYQMSTMMHLFIDIVDGKYTVTLKDIQVSTESAWAACNYEELSQDGLDDRGKGGRFSRKKLLKIYKVYRPLLEEEFDRYCTMFEQAVQIPTDKESDWLRPAER